MRFYHAERFTLAEVGGFATGRVFVRRYRDFVVVLSGIIGHTQLFRVKELPHITANFPRIIFTGHTTMIVFTVFRGCQFLLYLLAGFTAHINLYSWQISTLERGGIAAAGLPDVRAVGLSDADRFIFAGVQPCRPGPFLIGIKVLIEEPGGAYRVIEFPR